VFGCAQEVFARQGDYEMLVSNFARGAIFAASIFAVLCAVSTHAHAEPLACSLTEVFECTPSGGCKKLPAGSNNLPASVSLHVKEKKLFSGLFGGEGLMNSGDVYEDEKVLILHGRRALQTWTAVVNKQTGAYSGSVSELGKSFSQFGKCSIPVQ
jgi:hypothetical protein